ncbi:WXG100-like domain-containing protein [Nocardia vermiculata]|uniref:Outer membrane channel protein CpnT-like N-terminal domain-containing protein n=1 Tax=Nocardia vermiculata TaxID=257274 RepID=A0A846Y1D3_9NOCA|nr:hypothetical protein [Nocardia vermiculata]NKY50379.1 hypothetical protein [Nocardia vermiculata]
MSLYLPPPVRPIAWVAGASWPDGDEDKMWAVSRAWEQAHTDLAAQVSGIDAAKKAAMAAFPAGDAADQIGHLFDVFLQGDQSLATMAEGFKTVSESTFDVGTELQSAKINIIVSLCILLVEIAWAWLFPPTAPAVEAAAIGTTRSIVKFIADALQNALERAWAKLGFATRAELNGASRYWMKHILSPATWRGMRGQTWKYKAKTILPTAKGMGVYTLKFGEGALWAPVTNAIVQGAQIAEGKRHGFNWKEFGASWAASALSTIPSRELGRYMGFGISKHFGGAISSMPFRSGYFAQGAVIGATAGVFGNVFGNLGAGAVTGDIAGAFAGPEGWVGAAGRGAMVGGIRGIGTKTTTDSSGDPRFNLWMNQKAPWAPSSNRPPATPHESPAVTPHATPAVTPAPTPHETPVVSRAPTPTAPASTDTSGAVPHTNSVPTPSDGSSSSNHPAVTPSVVPNESGATGTGGHGPTWPLSNSNPAIAAESHGFDFGFDSPPPRSATPPSLSSDVSDSAGPAGTGNPWGSRLVPPSGASVPGPSSAVNHMGSGAEHSVDTVYTGKGKGRAWEFRLPDDADTGYRAGPADWTPQAASGSSHSGFGDGSTHHPGDVTGPVGASSHTSSPAPHTSPLFPPVESSTNTRIPPPLHAELFDGDGSVPHPSTIGVAHGDPSSQGVSTPAPIPRPTTGTPNFSRPFPDPVGPPPPAPTTGQHGASPNETGPRPHQQQPNFSRPLPSSARPVDPAVHPPVAPVHPPVPPMPTHAPPPPPPTHAPPEPPAGPPHTPPPPTPPVEPGAPAPDPRDDNPANLGPGKDYRAKTRPKRVPDIGPMPSPYDAPDAPGEQEWLDAAHLPPAPPEGSPGDPVGQNPFGEEPAGVNPFGENPAGVDPAGANPFGDNPFGDNPAGNDPNVDKPLEL